MYFTGLHEEVLSSCEALYEIPYSSPLSEECGQLTVTNFRVTFVPYQSTNVQSVSCALSCAFDICLLSA